ncbi:SDR family NAD(P)-dependent oxidoreductase [Solimonas sp. K1W22B-7]|uniref:SDR family NAD(P)-dependent oxidoreductase n=1 Tax=Solimonas sp. K1W22B-7 TaxID=2303331 RepID=UPI0013C45CF1|nr:SDR family NAD(P)-dependent oxidoreductase [Solimonas sp. K1W22B-7]
MIASFRQRYGEWAVVTGASSGIGEAFAHALAARGVRPLLVARREDELRRVAAAVQQRHGVECGWLALDLADPAFIERLAEACAGREVGLVIGNAAHNPAGAFLDLPREALLRTLDVNDRANLLLAHAFLPAFKARGRGGLLLVGSTEGYSGSPYSACYSASKAFVLSFGEALWGELRGSGVDVLVLVPNATDTPLLASRNVGARKIRGMSAPAVAQTGLDHLGKGPSVVPGPLNRWTFRVLRRLPRKWLVQAVGGAMRRIVVDMQRQA